ncbi:hypothetical protein NEIPOLOT_02406, partial [Neisseria polysaccharea ATCC 43768]
MPFTFVKSSTDLNAPFCARYSAMAFAFAGPIPGSASNSCGEAALMFTAAREKAQENSIQNSTNIFFMVFPLKVANNKTASCGDKTGHSKMNIPKFQAVPSQTRPDTVRIPSHHPRHFFRTKQKPP